MKTFVNIYSPRFILIEPHTVIGWCKNSSIFQHHKCTNLFYINVQCVRREDIKTWNSNRPPKKHDRLRSCISWKSKGWESILKIRYVWSEYSTIQEWIVDEKLRKIFSCSFFDQLQNWRGSVNKLIEMKSFKKNNIEKM